MGIGRHFLGLLMIGGAFISEFSANEIGNSLCGVRPVAPMQRASQTCFEGKALYCTRRVTFIHSLRSAHQPQVPADPPRWSTFVKENVSPATSAKYLMLAMSALPF